MRNRKIIRHVTWQYMKKNKIRTLTAFLGITMMVVLMTCVFVGKDTVFEMLSATAAAKNGKWHVNVYDADEDTYTQLMELPFIEKSAVSFTRGISAIDNPLDREKPYLQVKAYSEESFDMMNISFLEGKMPENKNEAVITDEFSRKYNINPGDKISVEYCKRMLKGKTNFTFFPFDNIYIHLNEIIEIGPDAGIYGSTDSYEQYDEMTGESDELTVTGIINTPEYEEGKLYYTVITLTDFIEAKEHSFNISLIANDNAGINVDFYHEIYMITKDLNTEFNDLVLIFSSRSSDSSLNLIADMITVFFMLLIAAVSVILIYNVFSISYEERNQYLGFLASVGATSAQKRSSVYFEAGILLAAALPAGISIGLAVVYAGVSLLKPYLGTIMSAIDYQRIDFSTFSLQITLWNISAVIVLSVITVFVSAVIPAFRAGKASVISSLRENNDKNEGRHFKTHRKAFESGNVKKLLAVNGLRFHRKKSAGIVRAMAVFMTVLIVASYGADSVIKLAEYSLIDAEMIIKSDGDYTVIPGIDNTESLKKVFNEDYGTEITGNYASTMLMHTDSFERSEEYKNAVRYIAKLYSSDYFERNKEYILEDVSVDAVFLTDDVFKKLALDCGASPEELDSDSEMPALIFQNSILSTSNMIFGDKRPSRHWTTELSESTSLKKGDKFSLDMDYPIKINQHEYGTGEEEHDFRAVGFVYRKQLKDIVNYQREGVLIISSLDGLKKHTDKPVAMEEIVIKITDPDSPQAKKLSEIDCYEGEDFSVYSHEFESEQMLSNINNAIKKMIRIMAYSFMLLVSLVCLLNIFNTVRARALLRKKEIAMLRSAGMESVQLNKMIAYENTLLFFRAVTASAAASSVLIYMLWTFLTDKFGSVGLPVSPVYASAALLFTLGALAVISEYCYRYKDKNSILENIRTEMV